MMGLFSAVFLGRAMDHTAARYLGKEPAAGDEAAYVFVWLWLILTGIFVVGSGVLLAIFGVQAVPLWLAIGVLLGEGWVAWVLATRLVNVMLQVQAAQGLTKEEAEYVAKSGMDGSDLLRARRADAAGRNDRDPDSK